MNNREELAKANNVVLQQLEERSEGLGYVTLFLIIGLSVVLLVVIVIIVFVARRLRLHKMRTHVLDVEHVKGQAVRSPEEEEEINTSKYSKRKNMAKIQPTKEEPSKEESKQIDSLLEDDTSNSATGPRSRNRKERTMNPKHRKVAQRLAYNSATISEPTFEEL
jgi:biopolymer transport protein ExbB/TolQ